MWQGFFQIALTIVILVAIAPFFGRYIARVFLGEKTLLDPVMNPVEQTIYALASVRAKDNMTSWQYVQAIFYSNLFMALLVFYLIMNQ